MQSALHSFVKGVVEAAVSMQRDRERVLRIHPSQVSFQFLRMIRGKWFIYRLVVLQEGRNGKEANNSEDLDKRGVFRCDCVTKMHQEVKY